MHTIPPPRRRSARWLLPLLVVLLLAPLLAGQPAAARTSVANPPTPLLPPAAPVAQELPPGGFIGVDGANLVRFGVPVRLKGVNYYPQGLPWKAMWRYWNGPQIERELRLGRDELGINAVRILLPYDVSGNGVVDERLLRLLREFLQITGSLNMRVIVTLFDFYDGFPAVGTEEEAANFQYLDRLIGNFHGDERIFSWDLHNEPDHYATWTSGNAQRALMWLGRMADHVRQLAPNHLVTVGMGQYDNLWQPGPDGRRVIDYSDVVSVHSYNAWDAARQLDELRSYTSKPVLLQEFGWPSSPTCLTQDFNEAMQAEVYRLFLEAAESRTAGVFAWNLRDYDPGPSRRWDTREEHYGLYRADNTLKPAAQLFAAYAAPPLPPITVTNYPLSERYHRLDGEKSPKRTESGYHVKDWFRMAWTHMGGRGSFGLPISEAFEQDDGRVIQYFEAAALELRSSAAHEPGFEGRPVHSQVMEMIRPLDIGREFTAGWEFPPPGPPPAAPPPGTLPDPNVRYFPETGYSVAGKFLQFYDTFSGPWRLGLPISPEVVETVAGAPVTRQYFERGLLEFHPATNVVQFGQIALPLWDQQCRGER